MCSILQATQDLCGFDLSRDHSKRLASSQRSLLCCARLIAKCLVAFRGMPSQARVEPPMAVPAYKLHVLLQCPCEEAFLPFLPDSAGVLLAKSGHQARHLLAGTRITDVEADIERAGVQLVKGFATIDNVALINVEVLPCSLSLEDLQDLPAIDIRSSSIGLLIGQSCPLSNMSTAEL